MAAELNIIARDLGLRDQKDVTSDGKQIGQFDITLKLTGDGKAE